MVFKLLFILVEFRSYLPLTGKFQSWQLVEHTSIEFFFFIFFVQTAGCKPIASVDHFVPENLGSAELVEEIQTGSSKIVKVMGLKRIGPTNKF